MNIIFGTVLTVFVSFILMCFVVLGMDFYRTVTNGVGWVWVERHGTAVKQWGEEKDGCINYVDVWDRQVKTCGIYETSRYQP